jgi:hypothetical protein
MNATHAKGSEEYDAFLNLVDFKWLMAGVGWRVNLSRLQSDGAYIDECLQRALRSDSELLRERSVELLGLRRSANAHCDVDMPSGGRTDCGECSDEFTAAAVRLQRPDMAGGQDDQQRACQQENLDHGKAGEAVQVPGPTVSAS